MIVSKQEYAEAVWSPTQEETEELEGIQKVTTKLGLKLKVCKERMNEVQLFILEKRRERRPSHNIYKLMNCQEEVESEDLLLIKERETREGRGHSWKLRKVRCVRSVK